MAAEARRVEEIRQRHSFKDAAGRCTWCATSECDANTLLARIEILTTRLYDAEQARDQAIRTNKWLGVDPPEGPIVKMSLAQFDALAQAEQRVAAMIARVQEFADAYPESVFPPFTARDEDVSRDRVAAAMGRHVATVLLAEFAALSHAPKEDKPA